mmetsp:Transcript_19533/g.48647  ORF Transcript_19533/g.48647 Transcript_19533/m.48647 type:complete len:520 (-) Transcript_19533:2413-3972(-)
MAESRDFFVLPENLGHRLMGLSENNQDGDSLSYVSSSLVISSDPKMVAHGRGLVAKTPIQAGELLFVHPPTIHAEISQVLRVYKNKATGSTREATPGASSLLESIAETILLKEMKRAVRGRKKESNARMAASFLALNSNHSTTQNGDACDTEKEEKDQQLALLRILLGEGSVEETEMILEDCGASIDDNDYLLGIIRHNAFGPDFHHYQRMEGELSKNNNNNNNHSTGCTALYSRILGHYPLAAMINHSCGPTNATRVFYKEIMVATATQAIPSGTEIVWPYCPPISPFPARNEQLENCYGFSCLSSNRSAVEKKAYELGIPPPEIPLGLENKNSLRSQQLDLKQWEKLLKTLEVWYMVVAAKIELSTSSNGEQQKQLLQHGLRLGHTQLYIKYFNQALQQQQMEDSREESSRILVSIVKEAEKLHSAFSVVHNACTEHLSLLHLCYELSATKTINVDRERIRFWTEQLKEAHLCRYSNELVGRDLVTLRTVLKHTRTVLRTQDGWKNSSSQNGINSFI